MAIMKKKKKKHDEVVLLAKTNLGCIKVNFQILNRIIEHDYFHLIYALRKYYYMKEEISKSET